MIDEGFAERCFSPLCSWFIQWFACEKQRARELQAGGSQPACNTMGTCTAEASINATVIANAITQ